MLRRNSFACLAFAQVSGMRFLGPEIPGIAGPDGERIAAADAQRVMRMQHVRVVRQGDKEYRVHEQGSQQNMVMNDGRVQMQEARYVLDPNDPDGHLYLRKAQGFPADPSTMQMQAQHHRIANPVYNYMPLGPGQSGQSVQHPAIPAERFRSLRSLGIDKEVLDSEETTPESTEGAPEAQEEEVVVPETDEQAGTLVKPQYLQTYEQVQPQVVDELSQTYKGSGEPTVVFPSPMSRRMLYGSQRLGLPSTRALTYLARVGSAPSIGFSGNGNVLGRSLRLGAPNPLTGVSHRGVTEYVPGGYTLIDRMWIPGRMFGGPGEQIPMGTLSITFLTSPSVGPLKLPQPGQTMLIPERQQLRCHGDGKSFTSPPQNSPMLNEQILKVYVKQTRQWVHVVLNLHLDNVFPNEGAFAFVQAAEFAIPGPLVNSVATTRLESMNPPLKVQLVNMD